ncbi:MAG: Na+/H+ antiporter NhaA [Wenzhouxiangellaceae bacterium]
MAINLLRDFFRLEAAAGIVLMAAAAAALIIANSPLAANYEQLLNLRIAVIAGELSLDKPLLLWINDGLMAVFFLLIGLELKREVVEGQLASRDQLILPLFAALGGLAAPAILYWLVNRDNGPALNGWAIPTATDIAFALGVVSLLGSRVPLSLKMFLTAIAIVDDLAAIIIIALFYTSDVDPHMLLAAAVGIVALAALNRLRVMRTAAYLLIGLLIWTLVLKSGVHATLAGVITALFIPLRRDDDTSPARRLEHQLHPWVAYLILPLFAFANAGVNLGGLSWTQLMEGVPLGIILGLVIGKQSGVFLCAWIAIRSRLAQLPAGVNWRQMYGISVITGIGFTMSLFIGSLAFEHGDFDYQNSVRLGVLCASLVCAVWGYAVLWLGANDASDDDDR